jgi:dipeptidyl aminopeptidase/acylaminoacyl peptidase
MKPIFKGRKYWVRLALTALFFLLIAFAAAVIGVSYRQAENYLHPPRQVSAGTLLQEQGIDYQEVELTTEDNVRLSAWYTPPKNGAVILVAHGYGASRPEHYHALFASHGYGVIAWDFRAHGKSEGEFTSLGYYETLDVKAALDFVLSQPGVQHIGAWGGSMGAVTMIRATAQYPQIEALVADSPFVTLGEEMEVRVPVPFLRSLIRFFAERTAGVTVEAVRPIDDIVSISPRPVFLIQGMDDGMVPLNSAERLFDAAHEPRQLWTEKDVPHLNMYAFYKTRYTKRVIKFFDEYLLSKK